MGIRDSLSRLRERLDPKSTRRRRKPDGTGSGTDGGGVDPEVSLLRPVPYVVAGGHDVGGSGSDAEGRQVSSRDQFLQPESAPNEQDGGIGPDVDEGEIVPGRSHLYTDVEIAVGRGSGRGEDANKEEGDRSKSRSSTPSTPRNWNPDGA